MDVTRDSSPRPAPRPASPPDAAAGGPGAGTAGSTAATGKTQPVRADSGGLTAPGPGRTPGPRCRRTRPPAS
ncbi:hypothetical protein ACFQ1I_22435 [Kitasatospora arboriphila]